jgi:response regulator RpfG family c-di-GMP phosphodiesterase
MIKKYETAFIVNQPLLIVDDDTLLVDVMAKQLGLLGYEVDAFYDSTVALAAIMDPERKYSCIVTDANMPNLDGLSLMRAAQDYQPFATRVMMSGQADLDMAMSAINQGHIYRFILKPWDQTVLVSVIADSVSFYKAAENRKQMQLELIDLSQRLKTANRQLQLNSCSLKRYSEHLLAEFSPYLAASTRIVVDLCEAFCGLSLLSGEEKQQLLTAASFHNIGLVSARRSTVKKSFLRPQQLTRWEQRVVSRHPAAAGALLEFFGELEAVPSIIAAHHERHDGSGYPHGLKGDEIPRVASFLSLACYYAECNIYGPGLMDQIKASAGRAFSEEAVVAFCEVIRLQQIPPKIRDIRIDDLCQGLVLAADIRSTTGECFLSLSHVLTRECVQRVRALAADGMLVNSVLVLA